MRQMERQRSKRRRDSAFERRGFGSSSEDDSAEEEGGTDDIEIRAASHTQGAATIVADNPGELQTMEATRQDSRRDSSTMNHQAFDGSDSSEEEDEEDKGEIEQGFERHNDRRYSDNGNVQNNDTWSNTAFDKVPREEQAHERLAQGVAPVRVEAPLTTTTMEAALSPMQTNQSPSASGPTSSGRSANMDRLRAQIDSMKAASMRSKMDAASSKPPTTIGEIVTTPTRGGGMTPTVVKSSQERQVAGKYTAREPSKKPKKSDEETLAAAAQYGINTSIFDSSSDEEEW